MLRVTVLLLFSALFLPPANLYAADEVGRFTRIESIEFCGR